MNPNTNNTPSSNASPAWWCQQNVNLTPVAQRFVMLLPNNNLSAVQYHLLNVTAPRPNYYPQLPINLSRSSSASIVPDKYAREVATVSNTPFQSTKEPEFVIGPAFSLADNHKDNPNLQTKDLSKAAGPSNCHQVSLLNNTITATMANQPFRGSVPPALQSSNVPPPSVEPQICIGSVFSLADEHTGNTGQQERGRYGNSFTTANSVGQKATGQEYQAWASSATVHYFPKTSGSYPKCITSQSNNPRLENSVSPKKALENYISSTPTNSLTSRTISGSSHERMISSTVDTAAGTLLISSYKQQNSNVATFTSNTAGSGAVNISGDKPISNQDSQIMPHAVAAKETEVVDLDTEDVDDCLLVKIDLRRHCMPFGIQIHNTEVVIHDSDTDDDNVGDITGQTSEADDQTAPANIVSCSDNISVSTTAIGDGESPHTAACSTVDVSGNGTCELIGSLTMEVEEISSETDNLSKAFLEQTPVSSNSVTNEIPTSPLDVLDSDIISSRCSVLDSETNPPDQVKTENSNSFSTSDSDLELLELHVDEETPQSIQNEYTNFKVITPSKFAVADNNLPDLKPEPVCVSLITSASSALALSSNTMDPVMDDAEDQDTHFEVTPQDQMTENHTNSITDISSPFTSTKNNATAKKRSKCPSIAELLTTTTSKKHIPVILMKSATKHSKQSSKKVGDHRRGFGAGISGAETQIVQNASSVMCKLCFLIFPSRMDLVTHTWNTHRHPLDQSQKCEFCDKSFASSSLLKLHQKINCTAFHGTRIVHVASTYIRKDSLLDRLFKGSKGTSKITTSTRRSDNSTDVLNENSESLLLNSCGNPNDSLLEHLLKVSKGTSTVNTSTINKDNPTDVLWVDRTSEARGGCMDQEKTFQNEPKRNNHLNHIDASLISSETDVISVPKSLFSNSKSLSSEPSIKDSDIECKKRLLKLDQPSTHRFAALSDTESEQGDVQSNITFNPDVEIHSESLLCKSGGNPNDKARIKCSSFPNQLQQDEHQRFSDGLKTSKNTHFKCFVCELVFTEFSSRYHHMWNTPRCFVGVCQYCSTCSNRFQNPSDKQAHLSLSKLCGMNEMQLMKEVSLCKENVQNNVHQDGTLFRVSGLNQENRMVTACRENINSNVYQNEPEMRVSSLIHKSVPLQTEDTFRIEPLQGTKETMLNENKRQQIPVEGVNNEKVLLAEVPENVNKEKMVHCMTRKAKFSSHGELLNHYIEKKCSATVSAVEDSPRSKELAKVMPSPTSLVYKSTQTENTHRNTKSNSGNGIKKKHAKKVQSCEIPTDISIAIESKSGNEIKKSHANKISSCEIASGIVESNSDYEIKKKHAQKVQSCQIPTIISTDITFNSVKEIKKKQAQKIRSCEIASGISSATHQVTLMCTYEGCMSVLEKPLDEENFVEKELNDLNMDVANLQSSDIPALNSNKKGSLTWVSLQPEVDVRIKGNLNEGNNVSKSLNSETAVLANTSLIPVCAKDEGHTDRNEEMFSDLSSTDCESDVDTSANEDGVEYKCRLCSKTFTNQSLLNKHTKLHHHSPQRKNIQCKVCTRKFRDLTGLQAHLLQFRYCFIPLTRKLWERKQDTQICNMCRVSVSSSKDLRKHCFKSMACRLRYVKMVLKKFKRRDISQSSVLPSRQSTETQISPSKKQKEDSESNQDNSEVSSSVPDLPDSYNLSRLQTNHLNTTPASSAIPAPLDCLNCGIAFSDFLGHLLLEQKCLDFYGIYSSKCPIPLPFCYKCKQCFDNMGMFTSHACPGFAPYTHTCSACGRKFTSGTNLNAHIKMCSRTLDVCEQSRNAQNGNLTLATNSRLRQQQDRRLSTPKAGDVATTSKAVQSAAQSYSCLICDARFPLLRLLMQHSYQHEEETALKCERCDTTFVHYNQFVSHQAFHIRMDKEHGILQTQLNELPPVLGKELPIASNSTKNQQDHTKSNNLFACLFCHQEFPNQISKAGHISNAPACLGIMKYIVENKFFSIDASDNQSCETKTNSCEFCHQICLNKISHYVQSGCINKLEQAILRFRAMSCHTEPMVPTGSKEAIDVGTISTTTKSNTPFIKAQSFCCPICKIQFNDQSLLSSHQRKIHGESSNHKSPPESMTIDTVGEPDALYCFTCSNYLQTVKEVEQHKAVCTKPHVVLPISVAVHVDLSQEHFRCKLCDIKYERERFLFNHIIGKHYDNVINPLLVASGQAAVLCSLCNNNILLLKVHSHFAQHRKAFLEGLSKSLINAKNNDTAECIFCNVFISRGLIQEHLKTHTISCIFAPGSHSAEKAALKTKSSEVTQTKVKEKKLKIETSVHKTETSGYAVRCKICYRVFPCEEDFKFHFKDSHQNCGEGSWSEQFILVKIFKTKPKTFIGASKRLGSANLAYDGDSSDRESLTDGSMVRQRNVHEGICFDSTNKTSSTSLGHKVAHYRPIGNCKICLRTFTNFLSFRFHLKTLHNRCDPEDAKTYFQAISASDKVSNFIKHKQQVSTAGSRDNLCRVCLMCRASFSDASLYQKHLKTHLVQCTVVLRDRCVNEPECAESDEDTLDFDVTIEYD